MDWGSSPAAPRSTPSPWDSFNQSTTTPDENDVTWTLLLPYKLDLGGSFQCLGLSPPAESWIRLYAIRGSVGPPLWPLYDLFSLALGSSGSPKCGAAYGSICGMGPAPLSTQHGEPRVISHPPISATSSRLWAHVLKIWIKRPQFY